MTGDESTDVGHLVLALLCEESLGGKFLKDVGVTIGRISEGGFGPQAAQTAAMLIDEGIEAESPVVSIRQAENFASSFDHATWFQRVHERAGFIARRSSREATEISSEHLLQAMVEVSGPARLQLVAAGVDVAVLLTELTELDEESLPTEDGLAVDFQLHIEPPTRRQSPLDVLRVATPTNPSSISPTPATSIPNDRSSDDRRGRSDTVIEDSQRLLSLLDANLNRSREGLRVLEDFARFVRRNLSATSELKELRHQLVAAECHLRESQRSVMQSRNVGADVGTSLTTHNEAHRSCLSDVITANARRVQESLRSLEEFGKILSPEFAAAVKQIRYRSYHLEQTLTDLHEEPAGNTSERRASRLARLAAAQLYVLLTESACREPWQQVATAALQGGADIIQLREKSLSDAELIHRGQWLSDACSAHDALFVLNDRVDLVAATGADGVHLGQDDLSISEARQRLDADVLIGVSTHQVQQVRDACAAGADYLGVGPVFPSVTKSFTDFPGLNFVQQAAAQAVRPWFAIGGVSEANIDRLCGQGATRVAVCSAVIAQPNPQSSTRQLKNRLNALDDDQTLPFSQK